MASSPSDTHGSRNVIQWLERLQHSAQNSAGAGMGGKAAKVLEKHERRRGRARARAGGADIGGDETSSNEDGETMLGGLSRAGEDAEENNMAVNESGEALPPAGAENLDVGIKVESDANVVSETLRQSDSLPDDAVPIGLLANLSISNRRERSRARSTASAEHSTGVGGNDEGAGLAVPGSSASHNVSRNAGKANSRNGGGSRSGVESEEDGDENNVGVANEMYFLSGPASNLDRRKKLIERHSPPEILVHGLVNAEDVEKLFEM